MQRSKHGCDTLRSEKYGVELYCCFGCPAWLPVSIWPRTSNLLVATTVTAVARPARLLLLLLWVAGMRAPLWAESRIAICNASAEYVQQQRNTGLGQHANI
jgi:hypothetical protein